MAIPMSCLTSNGGLEQERRATHLEDVLIRIRHLLPGIHQMLMPFPHNQIEILVRLPRYHAIVNHPLLVIPHYAPSIPMYRFEECEAGSVKSRVGIVWSPRERVDLDLESSCRWYGPTYAVGRRC